MDECEEPTYDGGYLLEQSALAWASVAEVAPTGNQHCRKFDHHGCCSPGEDSYADDAIRAESQNAFEWIVDGGQWNEFGNEVQEKWHDRKNELTPSIRWFRGGGGPIVRWVERGRHCDLSAFLEWMGRCYGAGGT